MVRTRSGAGAGDTAVVKPGDDFRQICDEALSVVSSNDEDTVASKAIYTMAMKVRQWEARANKALANRNDEDFSRNITHATCLS